MRTLTVGHLWLLHELGNALPEQAASDADVIEAVLVCSQRSHTAARRVMGSRFVKWACRFWGWCNRKKSFREEAALFNAYLKEELSSPERDSHGCGGSEVRVPLCWRLVAILMGDFGMRLTEALETPVRFVVCLWATDADRRGTSRLASERQIGFRKWAEEMERERARNLTTESTKSTKEAGARGQEAGGKS